MKKIIPGFVFVFLVITAVRAQVDHGGMGNFFAGSVYNYNPQLQDKLSSENLLGNGLQFNTSVVYYGGMGYAIQPNGFVLGGGGYTYQVSSVVPEGNAALNISCVHFNFGYLVLNKRKWIGFPYLGLGAFGTNFKVKNSTGDRVFNLGDEVIRPGQEVKYISEGLAFDIGFGLRHFQKNKTVKGVVGFDAGFSFYPSLYGWRNIDTGLHNTAMDVPFTMAGYLRLTIGLGAFYYRENQKILDCTLTQHLSIQKIKPDGNHFNHKYGK